MRSGISCGIIYKDLYKVYVVIESFTMIERTVRPKFIPSNTRCKRLTDTER